MSMQREFTDKCKGSLQREFMDNTEGVYREMQRKMTCTRCNQLQLFMTMLLANGDLQNLHL